MPSEMNCSQSFVNSLSVCDWSAPCPASGYCFQGEFGNWANLPYCDAGGYHSMSHPSASVCVSWLDGVSGGSSGSAFVSDTLVTAEAVVDAFVSGFFAGSLYAQPVAFCLFVLLCVVFFFTYAVKAYKGY